MRIGNENSDASRELNEGKLLLDIHRSVLPLHRFCGLYVTTKMSRLPRFAIFFLAAIHLLLFSTCPVSSRIYETNDAVVIEVDEAVEPSTRSARNGIYRRNPVAAIPMPYVLNPYYSGLYQQQQANFLSWFYPLRINQASASSSSVSDVIATKITESKQQQTITYCGDGPPSPPLLRSTPGITPPVVSIVGGTDAIPNSWPFIVGLRRPGVIVDGMVPVFCGGSLISPTRILTAAHCVHELTNSDISTMTVNLGMHTQGNLPNTTNDAQQTRRVIRAIYHKDFNIQTWQNDVAILSIDPPVVYSKDISPICLPPASTAADQFAGKNVAVIGWGQLKNNGQQPNALKQTTIQVIPQATCDQLWGQKSVIFNQHVCATAAGKDTCHGDSGGPMIAQLTEGSTTWTQIGITSFGTGSCPADPNNKPSVYANVAFFRNWIDRYTMDE